MDGSFVGQSGDRQAMREKHRRRIIIVLTCIVCVVAVSGIFTFLINSFLNKEYVLYEVKSSTETTDSKTVTYMDYNGKILKYSRDGISVIDASGETVWNGSYDMISPAVNICGDYVVAADIEGKSFIVYNGEEQGKEIFTEYPIVQACVSSQGVVAVLLEQESSNVINIYNPYDVSNNLLVEIPTNVDEGYPVCMDISPNGLNLVAAYVCVTSGKLQSRVVFYDFSDVGRNTNCLVGARNYDGHVVADVRFLSNENVCIFSDDGFSVWSDMKKPVQLYAKTFKSNIKSAFYNKNFIGMIFETEDGKMQNHLRMYNLKGKKALDIKFRDDYDCVRMYDNDEIVFYSNSKCMVYRKNGVKKFSSTIDAKVIEFLPTNRLNRYYIISENQIQEIKLKK